MSSVAQNQEEFRRRFKALVEIAEPTDLPIMFTALAEKMVETGEHNACIKFLDAANEPVSEEMAMAFEAVYSEEVG